MKGCSADRSRPSGTRSNTGVVCQSTVPDNRLCPRTYAAVDGAVSMEVGILVKTVIRLAEGHARTAAGDQAGIDRSEALKEATGPRSGTGGVGDGLVICSRGRRAADPVVDVGAFLLRVGHWEELSCQSLLRCGVEK